MPQHVLIVGAGIVGLSTAYALRKRGVAVTILERGAIPNPLAASSDHHRLIRHFYGAASGYAARMPDAFAAWRAMWADLHQPQDRYYAATGTLALSTEQGDYTDLSRAAMDAHGIAYEQIDSASEIARRFPAFDPDGAAYALLSEGGALMADRILTDLTEWLRENGATVRQHSPVAAIDTQATTVTLASGETLGADTILVTAGVATPRLIPDLSNTLTPTRTVIAYVDPPEDLREAWATAPCWADLGGTPHLWGMPPIAGLPLKLGNAGMRTQDGGDANRTATLEEQQQMIADYTGKLRGADRFRVRWAQANYWTLAPDAKFHLTKTDRTIIASADSGHGFKFGALSGQDIADAVTGAEEVDAVAARMAAG